MRVLKNALYLGAMQLSNILVALVVTPYITRIFGSELLGINSFALAVVTNFSIFGLFGITLYGLREIAKVRDNPILLQQTFSRCITFQLFFSTLALLGYLVWILTTNDGYAPYYLLFTLYLLGTATDLTWFYGGLERFDRVAIRTVLMRVLGGLLVFVVVRRADQLYLLILIQQGSVFLSNLFYWLPLRRYGIQVSLQPLRNTLQKMFTPSLLLFLPIVFTTLLLTIDRILLGYLSTKQEVAIYDYTARLVRIAIIVVSVLGNVLLPRFAYLWSSNQRAEFNTTLRKQQFYSLFSSALIAGLLFVTATEVCALLFGDTFQGASQLLRFLIFTVCLTGLALYHVGMAVGREKQILRALIVATLCNTVCNVILIPHYGSWGAAVSYVATELLLQLYYMFILRDLLPFRYLLRILLPLALIVAVGCYVLTMLHTTSLIADLLLRACLFGLGYLALGLLLFPEAREFLCSLLKRLRENEK